MKRHSIEWFILNAFATSSIGLDQYIPWEQGALLHRINSFREKINYAPLDNNSLGRQLSKLKSQGKVRRLRWFSPSTGNIWIWNNDN